MNPLKIFEYDPLDRTKLNWSGKFAAWLIEYIARIIGSVYLSISLMLVALWPKRSASKTLFNTLGTVCDMYRAKWMPEVWEEIHGTNERERMGKTNESKVYKVETTK